MIACPSCHRQFDVSALAVGAKVRCLCAELLVVPEIEVRDMEMLRCASCGGELEQDAKECGYCGSEVTLSARGFGGTCPQCFARLAKDAAFCCTCGTAIQLAGALQPLHDSPCPRCEAALAVQEFDGGSLVECTGCGGVWLEESVFEKVSREREGHAVSKFVTGRADVVTHKALPDSPVRYLKCPTCQQLMHRKNFASASGVIVDWCRGHGYWFDCDELARIIQFVAEGGMDLAREKAHQRQQAAARRSAWTDSRHRLPITETSLLGGRNRRHRPDDLLDVLGGLLRRWF